MTFRHCAAARADRSGPSFRNILALFAVGAAVAGAGFAARGIIAQQPTARALLAQAEPPAEAPQTAPRAEYSGLFDPAYSLGLAATSFDNAALLRAAILEPPAAAPAAPQAVAALAKPTPLAETDDAAPPSSASIAEAAPTPEAAVVPEPPRRPGDLAPAFTPRPEHPRPRVAAARVRRAPITQARAEPSFFERLFGSARAPEGPAMAYAAPGALPNDAGSIAPRLAPADSPAPRAGGGRAIYDITAQVVHMPDGSRLEAHSGLGAMRDNPQGAHLRMRGVTPPHVYNLRMREAPFHGVRAIRLLPVGGAGAIFGRAGLLAHTYMLGPGGDSNGCVSFRDYNAFLQAYLRGEVSQLVVVNSIRDATPRFAAR